MALSSPLFPFFPSPFLPFITLGGPFITFLMCPSLSGPCLSPCLIPFLGGPFLCFLSLGGPFLWGCPFLCPFLRRRQKLCTVKRRCFPWV